MDHAHSTISLPLDRYSLTFTEMHEIDYAWQLLVNKCMAGAGQSFEVVDMRGQIEPPSRRYGIWNLPEASRYGYDLPPPNGQEKKALEINRTRYPSEYVAKLDQCGRSSVLKKLELNSGQVQELNLAAYNETVQSLKGQAIIQDWRHCLSSKGVKTNGPGPSRWAPVVTSTGTKSIPTAVNDVTCKVDTRLIERLSALEAGIQTRIITKSHTQLEENFHSKTTALNFARSTAGGY